MPARPANQIHFAKMPTRNRSGSSPIRDSNKSLGPSVPITSSSRPPDNQRLRAGSLGAVEAMRVRARRGTGTSSELSSEGDGGSVFNKDKQPTSSPAKKSSKAAAVKFREENKEDNAEILKSQQEAEESPSEEDDDDLSSDDDSLASGFSDTVDDTSLLGRVNPLRQSPLSSSRPVLSPQGRQQNNQESEMSEDFKTFLPPPRPISILPPVSALAAAIKAKNKKPTNPVERFASLSGEGAPDPLSIKLYAPWSKDSDTPVEILLRRTTNEGTPVLVADAIGYSLWKYAEQERQPVLAARKFNVNAWVLRIVEDGEVDYDFAPLVRTKPMSDFTLNSNRTGRMRARGKQWDEFGLVEATDAQLRDNERTTPSYGLSDADTEQDESATGTPRPQGLLGAPSTPTTQPQLAKPAVPWVNPITDHRGGMTNLRKDSQPAMDIPTINADWHATPRMGAPRTLTIHWSDNDGRVHSTPIEVTSDTYISEVFDQICQILNVDKALYVLKVTGTTTVAPSDRTVEALGEHRSALDLMRRRFVGDGSFGLSGSPGSTSPNAPLILTTTGTPKKQRKIHPLAQQSENLADPGIGLGLALSNSNPGSGYKRYNVIRKQPMSFTPSQPRVLMLEGEYLHILPGDNAGFGAGSKAGGGYEGPAHGKTTSVHFSSVVGCKVSRKHPKIVRLVIFKERETKRYDFEATNSAEAAEIVQVIKRGVEPFKGVV